MIQIKRVYESPKKEDGYRVLVDRLWPRGIKKVDLLLNDWAKVLAPSKKLCEASRDASTSWGKFQSDYRKELQLK